MSSHIKSSKQLTLTFSYCFVKYIAQCLYCFSIFQSIYLFIIVEVRKQWFRVVNSKYKIWKLGNEIQFGVVVKRSG